MKTDLEKFEYVIGSLCCYDTRIKENEIELLVYDWSEYLGSVYFTLDGSLIRLEK